MVARWATLLYLGVLGSLRLVTEGGGQGVPSAGAGVAFRFEKGTCQGTEGAKERTIEPQQEEAAQSGSALRRTPRIEDAKVCFAADEQDVVMSILPSADADDADEMFELLRHVASGAMASKKTIPKQGSEIRCQVIQVGQSWQRSAQPLWKSTGKRGHDNICPVGGVLTTIEDTGGETRGPREAHGSAGIGIPTKGARRKRWPALAEDCQGDQWNPRGGKRSLSKGNHRQHSGSTKPSTSCTHLQSRQFEEDGREANHTGEGSRRGMGDICQEDERQVHGTTSSLLGSKSAAVQSLGREISGIDRGNRRFTTEGHGREEADNRSGKNGGRGGPNISLGSRDGATDYDGSGGLYADGEPTEQKGEVREVSAGNVSAPGASLEAAYRNCANSTGQSRRFCAATTFKVVGFSLLCESFSRFSQLFWEETEKCEMATNHWIMGSLMGDFLMRIFAVLIFFLPVIIGGYAFLLLGLFLWEAGENEVVIWNCLVTVSKKRVVTKRRWLKTGVNWKRMGMYYLLWYHHVGVLAGNNIPQGTSVSTTAHVEQDLENDFLDVFRHARDRKHHVFELWMHKPTWTTEFGHYKKLMSINMNKPHLEQIQSSWRTSEKWDSLDLVRVRLPTRWTQFPSFMGQRYMAYPEGEPARTPMMVFFNGVFKVMTGTVWLKSTEQGILTKELFDVIDPQHQCGSRQLCSVEGESLTLWPNNFQAAPGAFIQAKQIDLEESSSNNSDGMSDCSTACESDRDPCHVASSTRSHQDSEQMQEMSQSDGQDEGLGELSSLVQLNAAGLLPSSMRERSSPLWEMMAATWNMHQGQWMHERDIIERTVQVFDQDNIMSEIGGLARHREGWVTVFLLGIVDTQVGTKIINVNVHEMQDFLDLMVLVRRAWLTHVQVELFDLHYVTPQPPPAQTDGYDGITLLCDFRPRHHQIPVAVLTITDYEEDSSMDLTAYRVNPLTTCIYLQEITGLVMVCERNAECTCSNGGRFFESRTPMIVFAGSRLDILLSFRQHACKTLQETPEDDGVNLVQTGTRVNEHRAGPWIYGYPLNAHDRIRMWKGAIGTYTPQRTLANEYSRQRNLLHYQIRVYEVAPVPEDLAALNIEPYVMAAEDDYQIWQVLVLIDLHWETGSAEGTGSTSRPITEWRATRAIDFQLDTDTFFRQLGLAAFCSQSPTSCTAMVRGIPWTNGVLRFNSGEYIAVRIRKVHQNIPIGTQWEMSRDGCSFEEMPTRLGSPLGESEPHVPGTSSASRPEGSTNGTENRGMEPLPVAEEVQDDEVNALMQHQSSESFFIYIKGSSDPIVERLQGEELQDPVLSLRNRFASYFPDVPRNFLMMFYIVTQPRDLQVIQTTGMIHALANEIPEGRALILLDIEFYDNAGPRLRERPFAIDEWRETKEVHNYQTRREFLRQIGLGSFCQGKSKVCLVTHRGEMWTIQDQHKRLIRDGDYVIIKVKKVDQAHSTQEQWRAANGQCQEEGSSEYTQRLLQWDQRRHGGPPSHEEDLERSDNVSLLQIWRPSFARHARDGLRPPGNGARKVQFTDSVEVNGAATIDLAISNRFVQAFCEMRQDDGIDYMSKTFLQDFRFEKVKNSTGHEDQAEEKIMKNRDEGLSFLPIWTDCEQPIDERDVITLQLETLIPQTTREEKPERKSIKLDGNLLCDRSLVPTIEPQGLTDNFEGHDSTAVLLENPRLHDLEHVHDRFVDCDGLGELAARVTTPGGIKLETTVRHPELLESKIQAAISWAGQGLKSFTSFELYTNGSKLWCVSEQSQVAGWAVVVVGVDAMGERHLLGKLAGRVITDRDNHLCMGAVEENSDTAEMEAMIWAALWALQAPEVLKLHHCVIVSDSFTKVMAAEGQWKMPNTPQGMVLSNLIVALQQRVCLECRWTRAHRGDIYNEVADHCAKCAARFPGEEKPEADNMDIMDFGDALPWLWVAMTQGQRHGVQAFANHLCFRRPDPLQNADFFKQRQIHVEDKEIKVRTTVASYNINTMRGKSGGMHKEAILLDFLEKEQIGVTGLQETRRKQTKEWQRGSFFGFSSAAASGQGGIDIIFNRKTPLAWHEGQPIFIDASVCTVLFAESQMMAVQLKSDWVSLVFVSAHSPHDGTSVEQKEEFWNSLTKKISGIVLPVILMIDANAKVGKNTTQGIGDAFAENANTNTPYFQEMLDNLRLWLPSTEMGNIKDPTEEQGTWHHKGGLSRIDFVGVPLTWKSGWIMAAPRDVEFAETFKDHRLVSLDLEIDMITSTCKRSTQKMPDRRAMNTTEGKEIVRWLACQYERQRQPTTPPAGDQLLGDYEDYMQRKLIEWFPKEELAQRPSWITDEAWFALKEIKKMRRYVHDNKSWEKKAIMRQVFLSWKSKNAPEPDPTWLKSMQLARAWAQGRVNKMSDQTKKLLQRDEASFLQHCQAQFEAKCADANATDLWKTLKKHLPKMKDKVKSRAMRYADTQKAFEKHFAENERATNMKDQDLQDHLHQMSRRALDSGMNTPIEIRYLPTLQELENAIKRAKAGKACFGSAFPEWLLAAPRETAITIFPVLMDMFVYFQEPACLKGGNYYPLWKQKGSQKEPSSYRAILLSSFIGKAFHHILRQRLIRHFPKVMKGLQIGGLPRQRVQYGSHTLSLMRASANARNVSHAVIFFDMTSAFYHVERNLVVEDILEYSVHEENEEIALLPLLGDSAVQRAGVPAQLRAVLQETLTSSWFNVTGQLPENSNAWVPSRGTRPGDSCADLSFSFVMAGVLQGFMNEVEGILPVLQCEEKGDQVLQPITWIDDVAVMVEDRNAEELLNKTGKVAMAMKKHADGHGLTLNFKQGKTEALIRFQGPNSAQTHRRFREQGSKLDLQSPEGQNLQLLTTTKYSHLGAVQTVSMNNRAEVDMRIAKANTAFRMIKSKIMSNESIPMETRCHLAQSLVFARLVFGVEVWPELHGKLAEKMNKFIYKVYRAIAKKISRGEDHHFSNLEVEATILCTPIEAMIRLQRLRYLRKLGEEAPRLLIDLLDRDDREARVSWLGIIRADIEWVVCSCHTQLLDAQPCDLQRWWPYVIGMGKKWDRLVTSLTASETLRGHMEAKQKWTRGKEPLDEEGQRVLRGGTFLCPYCSASFYGNMARANHMRRRHGVNIEVRWYIVDTSCGSCQRDYQTLQRNRQHLQYSKACFEHLRSIWMPMSVDYVESVVCLKTSYRTPWCMREGPKLPCRDDWQKAAPWKRFPQLAVEKDLKSCLDACRDAANEREASELEECWLDLDF